MQQDKNFTMFQNLDEQLDYLYRYELLAVTKTQIPKYVYRYRSTVLPCQIIGYKENYDTFSTTVIDFGEGPHFINSDSLREMQSVKRDGKGKRLTELPNTYVIFDLETTDINIYKAEIIQISAIRIQNGEIADSFSSYVKPQKPIPKRITKLTGITDLDVCSSGAIETVLPQFLDFIKNDCLAGYNINSYDMNLLYDIANRNLDRIVRNNYFDFYLLFKSSIPKSAIESYKLTDVAEYYGLDIASAHNASTDCELCFECYKRLTDGVAADDSISTQNINVITTEFDKVLLSKLQEIIVSLELPADSLYLYSNRANKGMNKNVELSKSICIHEPEYPPNPNVQSIVGKNYVVLKIMQNDEQITLAIRQSQYNAIEHDFSDLVVSTKKTTLGYESHVIFENNDSRIMNFINNNVLYCLRNYHSSASFGCCSQFIACSDALKCLHENKLYSTGCTYRKHLDNGRIFYGKNKNID